MPNGGISIEDYLKYLEQQSARNLGQVDDQALVGQQVNVPLGQQVRAPRSDFRADLARAAGGDVVEEGT